MDRKIFKLPFVLSNETKFLCPTCSVGHLKIMKDTFHSKETLGSVKARTEDDWEPGWIKFIYSCVFQCSNTNCEDFVSSSGVGYIGEEYVYDFQGDISDIDITEYFYPEYFFPHLKIFDIPEKTPDIITNEVNKSFSLLFCDPSSSANHIRVALEHLLTQLKVNRFSNKSGRKTYINLHQRIDLLPAKFNHIKDLFFAVKWLGNAGSHAHHEVNLDDVLDAYELMNELLLDIYANRSKKAKSLAKKINKKKGPVKLPNKSQ